MIFMLSRFAVLSALAMVSSCALLELEPDYKPHDKLAVVPQEFLYTGHKPFTDWLDTPVHIQITDVPLTEVLEHPALRDLRVVWVESPKENPLITIHRVAITRRQLLWALGQDHELTMLAQTVPGGQSYVEIRPRAPRSGISDTLTAEGR
jgi:hypothetical protein